MFLFLEHTCTWWAHLPYSTITGACSYLELLYVVAFSVWCLVCIASDYVELHLLSLHKQLLICHVVLFSYIFKVVIVSTMHEWVLKSEFYFFFLSVWLHNAKSIQLKEISPTMNDMVVLQSNSNRGSLQILLRHPINKIRKTTQGWIVNVAV